MSKSLYLSAILFLFISCGGSAHRDENKAEGSAEETAVSIPSFDADSAYYYVERQVAFGPRVPNTEAHREAGLWLAGKLGSFADTLYTQETRVRAYDGTVLNIKNIIGAFQPEKKKACPVMCTLG